MERKITTNADGSMTLQNGEDILVIPAGAPEAARQTAIDEFFTTPEA